MVGIEFVLCTGLLFVTGSIESPFVLYTFTPVLTAGLFLNRKHTYVFAGLTILAIVSSALFNPLYVMHSVPLFLSQLSLYLVAVCLTATLPYLVNVNVRQLMEEENILAERRRLSRDIHDGVAQTLHALCWQVQILRHRQAQANKDDSDLLKLETLAEKARRDILESLQILRSVDSTRSFQNSLKESVQKLKQESEIEVFLNMETEENIHLESHVELEMMRICQEALNNIRKHSGARTVQVDLKNIDSKLELTIEDDGCGFDSLKYYRGELPVKDHHGLSVMHERAQSINARLRVLSMPNKGTEIKLEVPYKLN
jgi:signal transduction histidine kinase